MGSIFICAAVYLLLLMGGMRAIRKKGSKREGVLFALIVGWCAYMSLARIVNWPNGSIIHVYYWIFNPIGQWIDQLLGGTAVAFS